MPETPSDAHDDLLRAWSAPELRALVVAASDKRTFNFEALYAPTPNQPPYSIGPS